MMEQQYAQRTYGFKRLFRKILFWIATTMPFLKAEFRARIHKLAGVNIINPRKTFIGQGVFFDDIYPEDITVEEGTFITSGCKILAHFIDPCWADYQHMRRGKVHIKKNVFIGVNVVIVKPITIGYGAIIGANSVVSKDVPAMTIYAGNPAQMVKERVIKYKEKEKNE